MQLSLKGFADKRQSHWWNRVVAEPEAKTT